MVLNSHTWNARRIPVRLTVRDCCVITWVDRGRDHGGRWGSYCWWVFSMASKIRLGKMFWLSFRWLLAANLVVFMTAVHTYFYICIRILYQIVYPQIIQGGYRIENRLFSMLLWLALIYTASLIHFSGRSFAVVLRMQKIAECAKICVVVL